MILSVHPDSEVVANMVVNSTASLFSGRRSGQAGPYLANRSIRQCNNAPIFGRQPPRQSHRFQRWATKNDAEGTRTIFHAQKLCELKGGDCMLVVCVLDELLNVQQVTQFPMDLSPDFSA